MSKLSQVLSDVTSQTGLAITRSIAAGERDLYKLAALRHYRCHKDEEEIAKADGNMARRTSLRPEAIPGNVQLLHPPN